MTAGGAFARTNSPACRSETQAAYNGTMPLPNPFLLNSRDAPDNGKRQPSPELRSIRDAFTKLDAKPARAPQPAPTRPYVPSTIGKEKTAMRLIRGLAGVLFALALNAQALAAGIDPRRYTCTDLQSVIASRGYVFLSQPAFGDVVVANRSYCPNNAIVELRSVPTRDNPECPVNYCVERGMMGGGM
jgi:hypothetical protein